MYRIRVDYTLKNFLHVEKSIIELKKLNLKIDKSNSKDGDVSPKLVRIRSNIVVPELHL